MIADIEDVLSSKINVKEYSSDIEAAKALLDGEVDAAIYNKAYTSVIAESLENDEYEDQVRVLYQYGIETSIDKGDVKVGEPFNILISGIDVYGDISQTSRSDVNIIVTVNPKTKKITNWLSQVSPSKKLRVWRLRVNLLLPITKPPIYTAK
jgi:hypothetical protein